MRDSTLTRHGRSKEKRSDCPLIVPALVVNVEGFIKHSAIFKGNMADCNTLREIIESLMSATITTPVTAGGKKRIVVWCAVCIWQSWQRGSGNGCNTGNNCLNGRGFA